MTREPTRLGILVRVNRRGRYYAVRIHQWPAAGPGADVDLRTGAADGRGRSLTLVDGRTQRDGPLATPALVPGSARVLDWSTFPTEPAALARRMRAAADRLGLREHGTPTTRDYVLTAAMLIVRPDRVRPATLQGSTTSSPASPASGSWAT